MPEESFFPDPKTCLKQGLQAAAFSFFLSREFLARKRAEVISPKRCGTDHRPD